MSDKFIICDGTNKTFCIPKCSNVSTPSNPQAILSADFRRAKTEFCVLVKPQKINPGLIQIFHEMPKEKLPGFKPQCVWGTLSLYHLMIVQELAFADVDLPVPRWFSICDDLLELRFWMVAHGC